jgi:DNA helicase IV
MRLPPEDQLSREQKEACFAPTEGACLVVGPPGSGKTVVAIFRQHALRRQNRPVQTLVYNLVLRSYTGIEKTFYSWLSSWWKEATRRAFPYAWQDGKRSFDFGEAARLARTEMRDALRARGNWGHLILDEAQDFDRRAHEFLCVTRASAFQGVAQGNTPSMTILADENQRLNAANSTLEEIKRAHLLTNDDVYHLRRNYRNTLQIAKVAGHFYAGLPTGIPELPNEQGDKPKLVVTKDLDQAVARIADFVRIHDNKDVGVLVYYDNTRKRLFNKLANRLRQTGVCVQTYTSDRDDVHSDATRLRFDEGGSVTVLCFASAKGLEFDAVFLPELQTVPVDDQNELVTKMNLYVMVSRARTHLFLLVSDSARGTGIWKLLPVESGDLEIEA